MSIEVFFFGALQERKFFFPGKWYYAFKNFTSAVMPISSEPRLTRADEWPCGVCTSGFPLVTAVSILRALINVWNETNVPYRHDHLCLYWGKNRDGGGYNIKLWNNKRNWELRIFIPKRSRKDSNDGNPSSAKENDTSKIKIGTIKRICPSEIAK